jgi:ABC-type multidrug transport system fused ATPase/permease subunit
MKKIVQVIILFLIASIFASIAPAKQNFASSIGTDQVVSSIVEKLRTSAIDVIQELQVAVGVNSFQIRQSLLLMISEIEHGALTLQNKVFKNLNRTQQDLFRNAEFAIWEAKQAADKPLDSLNNTTQILVTALERLPLVDKSPRVLRASPLFLVSKEGSGTTVISVTGSRLNYDAPSLTINNIKCTVAGRTDIKLDFVCPNSIIKAESSVVPLSGALIVGDVKSFWQKLKKLFRYYREEKRYQLLIQVVPQNLGTYTLHTINEQDIEERAERSAPISAANDHCQGERTHGPFTFSVLGGPEWSIVPGSVRWGGETSGNRGRDLQGPFDVTPKGFRYMVKLQNGGSCVKAFGEIVSYDARAWLSGNVLWTETRTVKARKEDDIASGALIWGKDVAIALPPGLISFALTVSQIDGSSPIVIDKDNSLRWFKVDLDTEKNILLIRPRNVEEAMR